MAVVLYELLTGCKPYRLKYGTASEIERAIAETDPRPASDVAADPALKRQLRGDLDAILNKAMKKSPTERYASIAAFAEDIKRHLNDIPVLARPDHIVYKSRKFIARHMLPLSVASLILICLLAGGALVLRQARIARTQALRAEAVQQFLLSIFESNSRDQSDPLRAQRTTARELLDIGAARLHDTSGAALPKESRDQLRSAISALYDQLGLSAQAAAVGVELVDSLRARGRDAEVELANALISLAAAEQQTNQFYAALPLLREAESISARHPSDERLAGYVSSYLANQLTPTDESVRYAERAVTLLRRAEPRGDEMLGALLMIASTKRYSDPNAAESAANEALQLVAATHGPQHQLYAETALTLADIQSARMEEAADATFRKADDIAQKVTEAGHYLRIQTDLRYGLALAEHDQADAAGLRLRRALDAAVQVDGPDDPIYVAWAHEFLARAEWRRGKLDAARREIDAALRIYRKRKPDDVLAKVAELAFDIALAQGRNADAQKLLDEARSGRTNSGMIRVSGFHEAVASREAWLDLENGDAARAAPAFKAIADTQVPPVQRFLENKIGARVGLARALRELRDTDSATAAARRALAELDELGNPVPLRPIAVLAWVEVAADEQAAGDCASAHQAALQAATLMAASADSESFRHKWLIDLAACK
jgi:serine/threonine-protein kinase